MSKKIAMTGATGFAGRHAITELLKRGHRVTALAREPARARLPPGVELVAGHLEDAAALATLVRGADTIVHLAGVVAAARSRDYFRHNTVPTRALAAAAARAGIKRFVFASSLAAREPELSPYGASKFAAEQALKQAENHLNTVILRAPAIYGPGDRVTLPLIRQLTRQFAMIPGRRGQRFSLLHVTDFARIVSDAVAGDTTGVLEVSDGTGGGYCWGDLIEIAQATEGRIVRPVFLPRSVVAGVALFTSGIARITGKPGMITPGKVREIYHADWVVQTPGLTLDEPITFARAFPELLAWYRLAGWLPPRREADKSGASSHREAGE
jgi:nucleoside-diphosphate-sugar epimerase